jgi:putative hydrolase of the HAD superfamily
MGVGGLPRAPTLRSPQAKVAVLRALVQTLIGMNTDRSVEGTRAPRFAGVLFDFGGTLDADGVPSLEQFWRAYRAAGGGGSAVEFESIFRESDRQLASDPSTRSLGFRETVALQSRLIAALAGDAEHLDASQIESSVSQGAMWTAERNASLLRAIRDLGSRIAVVSNFTGNLVRCLLELQLAPLVDAVVDSSVVGVRKPDPTIFALALDELGVEPTRSLMVGDNPFADVRPAMALGMATCWLAPLSRPIPEGCAPTFRIASLPELLPYCESASSRAASTPFTACTG